MEAESSALLAVYLPSGNLGWGWGDSRDSGLLESPPSPHPRLCPFISTRDQQVFGSVYGHGPRCPGGDWCLEPSQHPHGHKTLGRLLPCSRYLSVLLPSEKLEALKGRVRFQDHSQVAGLHLKSGSSPRVFRVEITGACAARGFWLSCCTAVGCLFLLPAFNFYQRISSPPPSFSVPS